jgi:hypothetical protein
MREVLPHFALQALQLLSRSTVAHVELPPHPQAPDQADAPCPRVIHGRRSARHAGADGG